MFSYVLHSVFGGAAACLRKSWANYSLPRCKKCVLTAAMGAAWYTSMAIVIPVAAQNPTLKNTPPETVPLSSLDRPGRYRIETSERHTFLIDSSTGDVWRWGWRQSQTPACVKQAQGGSIDGTCMIWSWTLTTKDR